MELSHDFRVGAPPAQAWSVLTDVERIAPLLPGAQLQEVEGDEYRGVVKVKVGPITAQYKGTASWQELDEANRKAVLKATGRDTRGQGNASATITMSLTPDGEGTKVDVVTDLTITGKVAQFGRGVLADVSTKLLGQFVDALEADLDKDDSSPPAAEGVAAAPGGGGTLIDAGSSSAQAASAEPAAEPADSAGTGAGSAGSGSAESAESAGAASNAEDAAGASSGPRRIDSPEAKPVDLLDVAGGSVAKRLIPVAGIALAVLLFVLRRARRR